MNAAQKAWATRRAQMPVPLDSYSRIIVAFSGGKDSLACLLHLFDLGVDKSKIELWHHDVDGREGSTLMDWACTRDYCAKVAAAFGLPIYFSWKVGGFEGEMTRDGRATERTAFETPNGVVYAGGNGPDGTRLKFPQVSADLSVRWCSAYLKIDVCAIAIRNQERFNNSRTLVVTGERAEESTARSKYLPFETHRSDKRNGESGRHVDQWRPVHAWSEQAVWKIIEDYRVNPHPAYRLGWGRVSCAACIFGSPNQWASLRAVNPVQFEKVAGYEKLFGLTIQRKKNVGQLADAGNAYQMTESDRRAALAKEFEEPVIVENWKLPSGAFGESCGPT